MLYQEIFLKVKFITKKVYLIEELPSQKVSCKACYLFPSILFATDITDKVCTIKGKTNSNNKLERDIESYSG